MSIGFLEKDYPRCLSTAVSEGIHGGYDISLLLMWVVKSDWFC